MSGLRGVRRSETRELFAEEIQVSKDMKYSCVLMFGGPGSGKGTQGEVLGRMSNMVHLSTGDIFRGLDKESQLGKEFLSYSTKGLLVPDEFTVRLFKQHVENLVDAGEVRLDYHTLILDGIPRTIRQVDLLEDIVSIKRVVYLMMADRDALVARLAGRAKKANRPDDADPEVIRKRIEVYEQETAPVLGAYAKKLIAKVNGDQPPLAVLRDVADALVGFVSANI